MTVKATGRRTFFHQRGANAYLDAEHFPFDQREAKIFHLGYLLLLDRLDQADPEFGTVAARVLHRAREAGFQTSIDVVSEDSHRFPAVVLPTLPYVDTCILNEFEAERTTGIACRSEGGPDPDGLWRASVRLMEAGVRRQVLLHFREGATALGRDGIFHWQGSLQIPQTKIVSTVGAGDAFAAGALYALHEGLPIGDVLHHAVCVAAACLQGTGTSDGVRSLPECLAMAAEFGFRPQPEPIH
jgi:sugar/nucleoside kinase (ribokinase family)